MSQGARSQSPAGRETGETAAFERAEVEAALAGYVRLAFTQRDWAAWVDLFTDDARYTDHRLGTFEGRTAVAEGIVPALQASTAMTFAVDWSIVEGNRAVVYVWNVLPDPAGRSRVFAFPRVVVLTYAGDGRWSAQEDFSNPAVAKGVLDAWATAGGGAHTEANHALRGVPDAYPQPSNVRHSREEIEDEFASFIGRGRAAVASGDWGPWADQFSPDARFHEHHAGRFRGREAIRDWITTGSQTLPMTFPVSWHVADGNRVVMEYQNRLPDPSGGDRLFGFPTLVVLHYDGDGLWGFEEDIYNPDEALPVVEAWLAAGGSLPQPAATS